MSEHEPPRHPEGPPDLSHLPPPVAPVPARRPDRPRPALLVVGGGVVFVLLAGGFAVWGDTGDGYPKMSLGDGVENIAVLALFVMPFVLLAAGVVWKGRRAALIWAVAPLLVVAGFVGFVLSALIQFGRCETCEVL